MGKGRALNLLQDTTTVANYVRVRLPPCFLKKKSARPTFQSNPWLGEWGKEENVFSAFHFHFRAIIFSCSLSPRSKSFFPDSIFSFCHRSSVCPRSGHRTLSPHLTVVLLHSSPHASPPPLPHPIPLLLLPFSIYRGAPSSSFSSFSRFPPSLPPSLRPAAGGDPKPLSRLPPPPSSLHLSIFRPFYHLLPLSASLSLKRTL